MSRPSSETVLLAMPAGPRASTRSSTRRVETPPRQAARSTAAGALPLVVRGSGKGGKGGGALARRFGMRSWSEPGRVSGARSR